MNLINEQKFMKYFKFIDYWINGINKFSLLYLINEIN